MKNTEIFNDYDMVVSYTQKLINDQLTHLTRMGVIHSELILVQQVDDSGTNYVYKVLTSADDIKDGDVYINATVLPQINISRTGTDVTFVLKFLSGEAGFWVGRGRLGHVQKFDMAGWQYGVDISLDLAKIEKDDIQSKIKVPDLVERQLNEFIDSDFSVENLFMDFESTNLLRFDPAHTDTKESGEIGQQQLAQFMQFYIEDLKKDGNPYILGYAINTSDQTQYKPNENVPPTLQPVGTTFTVYNDPENADRGNLNFVLATKGGKGRIEGTPGTLDSNWFLETGDLQAKMIVSHSDLIEQFILKPFFTELRDGVYDQIKSAIQVTENNNYDQAKKVTGTGTAYTISDVTHGDDQYVNTYSVAVKNSTGKTELDFSGHLYFRKNVSKNVGCTATAHSDATIDWQTTVTIETTKNAKGEPTLKLSQGTIAFNPSPTHDSDMNTCAKALSWIGKILGTILDAFTFFTDHNFFANLFQDVFSVNEPRIGNVGDVFAHISNGLKNFVILPAGNVFFFKNPSIDEYSNFYLDLTYQSENQ